MSMKESHISKPIVWFFAIVISIGILFCLGWEFIFVERNIENSYYISCAQAELKFYSDFAEIAGVIKYDRLGVSNITFIGEMDVGGIHDTFSLNGPLTIYPSYSDNDNLCGEFHLDYARFGENLVNFLGTSGAVAHIYSNGVIDIQYTKESELKDIFLIPKTANK